MIQLSHFTPHGRMRLSETELLLLAHYASLHYDAECQREALLFKNLARIVHDANEEPYLVQVNSDKLDLWSKVVEGLGQCPVDENRQRLRDRLREAFFWLRSLADFAYASCEQTGRTKLGT